MPRMYESFRWLRDDLTYAGPIGNKAQFKGVALYPTISGNHRKYITRELQASARTLVNKPVTLNHNSDVKLGNVRWAEHEDGRIEYVIELKDSEYIQKLRDKSNLSVEEYVAKWGRQPVYGVSVEANYRYHDEECSEDGSCRITPYGIIFNALSLVEDPEVPGVEGTTIELMEMLHEQSYNEANIVGLLLHDYSRWHGMPKRLAESYDHEVVQKMKKKKKQTEETVPTKKHKDVVLEASVSGDPRAQFLMEQQETPADTGEGECPEGEHKDPETGKCVPDEKVTEQDDIKPGSHYCEEHPDDPRCKKHKADIHGATEQEGECPEGMHKDEQGKCVPDQPPEATTPEFPATDTSPPVTPIPDVAESHRLGEPFADYSSFEDCVSKNQDKDDPEAYCADIKRKTEGETLKRLNKMERDIEEIKRLLSNSGNLAEVEDVKRKQRDKKLDASIKKLNEQVEQLDFKVESISQTTSATRGNINKSLHVINENFNALDAWRKSQDALVKRQCDGIGKTEKTLESLNAKVGVLKESFDGKLKNVGVLARNLVHVVSGLNEAHQLNSAAVSETARSVSQIHGLVRSNTTHIQGLRGKVNIGEKAWRNLQRLNKAYEQDKATQATKLRETQKNHRKSQETRGRTEGKIRRNRNFENTCEAQL